MIETLDEATSPVIFIDQHCFDNHLAGGIGLDDMAQWKYAL